MNTAVKDNNFIAIQGWMRNQLDLKGYELIIYALIYGFSQDGNSKFSGTRRYIAEWCGCSMRTVDNTLASLLDRNLIAKHEKYVNGIRACDYTAIAPEIATRQNDTQAPTNTQTTVNTTTEPAMAEPQPLLNEPQAPAQPKEPDPTEEIIGYLNQRAETHYKATTANTRKLVKARLKEGFTVDEFKTVINKKCADWLNNRDMAQYLRPETLFGPKFESYLNAKSMPQTRPNTYANTYADTAAQPIDDEGHMAQCTQENGWF